ncbi:repulsive guidance molecule A-like isoform X2 [Anneissia japonica]|uniref:repulsive guidance molecule A-like isoform X2 n=1 Tax=Anneissia japonica TaxID=1529436 RepID=UPI0014258826|nr:repulsive guidance molecule A-like isoform X2 [Anneissia japonica]
MEIRACEPASRSSHFPDYGLATWKVMGKRRFNSAAFGPIALVIKFVILCSLFQTVFSECKVLRCSHQYTAATDSLTESDVLQQCQALQRYQTCTQNTARSCRGNLNYHTITTYIPDLMQDYDCANILANIPTTTRRPPKGTRMTVTAKRSRPTPPERDSTCDYRGNRRPEDLTHCGLFGDPHLRTFSDKFQTCKVSGAWPLVYNDYLAVSVTNIPVNGSSGATATSRISVVIKSHDKCAEQKIYFAESGRLPAAFIDGTNTSGPRQSVVILEMIPGRHVEIHLQYVATTIVLRQVGRYLTFALSMPKDLIQDKEEDALQLCVKGCPARERIYFKDFLSLRYKQLENLETTRTLTSRTEAIAKCKKAEVTNDYFDSCVFDLMTTGNVNFSLAAQHAFMDVKRLHPNPKLVLVNRTSIFEKDPPRVEPSENLPNRTNVLHASTTWTIILLLATVLVTFSLKR